MTNPAAIPADSLLLHIGVPKTGTTAIQSALGGLSENLQQFGMSMPGTPLQQARAALSAVGAVVGWGGADRAPYGRHHWVALEEQLTAARKHGPGRMFVSSEYFCEAKPAQVDQIISDLGRYDPHVVVTLRPLSKILPSAWQQYLKSGHQLPYEEWLHAVLDEPRRKDVTPSFWRRHDHGAVIRRWAGRAGADHTVVMVLDPTDRDLIYRSFSGLLGLPQGLVKESYEGRENRSMTAAESELFRQVNVFMRAQKVAWDDYAHLVRYGAIARTVRNGAGATPATALRTPDWALERAAELGARYVEAIRESGATVVGDLDLLSAPAQLSGTPTEPVTRIPVEVAVEALLGAVARSIEGRSWFMAERVEEAELTGESSETVDGAGHAPIAVGRPGLPPVRDTMPVGRLTTRQLAGVVSSRLRRGMLRRWRVSAVRKVVRRSHS